MENVFLTYRELKAAIEKIPDNLLDKNVELYDEFGVSAPGGDLLVTDENVFISPRG